MIAPSTGTPATIIALALTTVLVAFAQIFWVRRTNKELLPKARAGMIKTIRELAGTRTPFFLLDQARQLKSFNYRLAMPIPTVVIGDAATARSILSDPKHDKPFEMLKSFNITLGGTNMFTQPSEKARITRMKTARAFSMKEVRGRINSTCNRHIDEWIDTTLKPAIEAGSTIDPCHEMLYVAFRIVCEAVFEYEASREECESFLAHGVVTATEFGFKEGMNPLRPILGKLLPERAKAFESVEWVQKFGLTMLREFQTKKKDGRNAKDCHTVINIIDSDDRYKSNEEKLPELMLWLFAGHDTLGYSMGIILWLLAQHPSEMAKVRDAMRSGSADESELYNVKEVQNAIKESHRLFPTTASISMRKLGEDVKTGDGHFIPKGTTAFLPQYLHNHDPLIYKNPELFVPDRWDNATKEMIDAHMKFAVGPRSCPGQSFAQAEINLFISKLILDYDFELVEKGGTSFFISLKPVGVLLRPKYAT